MNMLCLPVGPLQANCYLVWDDSLAACAVDPGGEPERLAEVVRSKGMRLETILVTHGHFDHVEGVAGLATETGASIHCSTEVAPVLLGSTECSATGMPVPAVEDSLVRAVEDGAKLKVGELSVRVIATPGHTPGDLTFDIDGALFCGDLLFNGSVGRTDFAGGDLRVLLASIKGLIDAYPSDTRVYPGHMQSTSLGQEAKHNPFLRGLNVDG